MDDVGDRIVQAGLDRLASLKAERDRLDQEMRMLLPEIQAACGHPEKEVVEGEYHQHRIGGADPPFRVCRRCGYSEPGWNCGYFKLHPDSPNISHMARDEAWKFIRGGLMSQEEKDRLFQARWDREAAARAAEEPEAVASAERPPA
jgi:hypothetical protein